LPPANPTGGAGFPSHLHWGGGWCYFASRPNM
jgi:hypothetical protein